MHGAEHFGVSTERFALTSTVFVLAIAFTPLVLAPLSEVVGVTFKAFLTSVWPKSHLSSNVDTVGPWASTLTAGEHCSFCRRRFHQILEGY